MLTLMIFLANLLITKLKCGESYQNIDNYINNHQLSNQK